MCAPTFCCVVDIAPAVLDLLEQSFVRFRTGAVIEEWLLLVDVSKTQMTPRRRSIFSTSVDFGRAAQAPLMAAPYSSPL